MINKNCTFVIPTKGRIKELKVTLYSLKEYILQYPFIVLDDGSTDGTEEFIKEEYPSVKYIKHSKSKGIHAVRNRLFNEVKTLYMISIDDDANFLQFEIDKIQEYFEQNSKVSLLSFRAYWDKNPPRNYTYKKETLRVKGFGAVSFAFRMTTWKEIPNLLEWFLFYGEEDYIAFQFYKKNIEIHYFPDILVHHRVDVKSRKKQKDYRLRLRRSLRSGWYLYLLFFPLKEIPRRFLYTLWIQIKKKTFKGDMKATLAIVQAIGDVIYNFPRLMKNTNRLSKEEFIQYEQLPETKLYWTPKEK